MSGFLSSRPTRVPGGYACLVRILPDDGRSGDAKPIASTLPTRNRNDAVVTARALSFLLREQVVAQNAALRARRAVATDLFPSSADYDAPVTSRLLHSHG